MNKQTSPWLWRAIGFLAVFAVVGYLVLQERETGQRVARAEAFDPCVSLAQAVEGGADKSRIRTLTKECRGFLIGLGPIIPLKLSCAILRQGGYECPKPGSKAARREVGAGSGTSSPHGQPSPASVGGKKASKPSHHPHKKRSGRPAGPAAAAPAAPPAQPGNSGSGASGDHGVDACVDVAVSACVKAELP